MSGTTKCRVLFWYGLLGAALSGLAFWITYEVGLGWLAAMWGGATVVYLGGSAVSFWFGYVEED